MVEQPCMNKRNPEWMDGNGNGVMLRLFHWKLPAGGVSIKRADSGVLPNNKNAYWTIGYYSKHLQ